MCVKEDLPYFTRALPDQRVDKFEEEVWSIVVNSRLEGEHQWTVRGNHASGKGQKVTLERPVNNLGNMEFHTCLIFGYRAQISLDSLKFLL